MKKADRQHLAKLAELGCVACYVQFEVWGTPGEIHHLRDGAGFAQRGAHQEAICLCLGHHRYDDKQAGKIALHGNSGQPAFESLYGTERELLEITRKNL